MRTLNKQVTGIQGQIDQARKNLKDAQNNLSRDRLNPCIINIVKNLTEKLIGLNDLEEQSLKQKSKIE